MSNIEALVRDAAPRTAHSAESMLAAVAVSEEAAVIARPALRHKRVFAGVALTAVLAVSGGAVAMAASHSIWWSAPNEVTYEVDLATDSTAPFSTVSFIPAAEYASGVAASTRGAEQAFRLAQAWLIDHAFTVDVPQDSQVVTEDDRAAMPEAPNAIILQGKAQRASEAQIRAAVDARSSAVEVDLNAYLAEQGVEEGLIVVNFNQGAYEVLQGQRFPVTMIGCG